MEVSAMISKPNRHLFWEPLLIALAVALGACAGAATPLPTATPTTQPLPAMSPDELEQCIAEAIGRQGDSYSQEWDIRQLGDEVIVTRWDRNCAECRPGDLFAECGGANRKYRVLWQGGRCVLDSQGTIMWWGTEACPTPIPTNTPTETATQSPQPFDDADTRRLARKQ